MGGLPTDEDGHIITSAEFGEHVMVKITYHTEADGTPIPEFGEDGWKVIDLPTTFHGPFVDEAEAQAWIDAYPDGDTNIDDMVTIPLNAVRPK